MVKSSTHFVNEYSLTVIHDVNDFYLSICICMERLESNHQLQKELRPRRESPRHGPSSGTLDGACPSLAALRLKSLDC